MDRIEKIDERERKLEIIIERLNIMIEKHDEDIKGNKRRLNILENKKANTYENLIKILVAAICGGIVAFLFDWISFKGGF